MERENQFLILQRSLSCDGFWRNVYLDGWKKIMESFIEHENSISALINSLLVSGERKNIGLQLLDLYIEKAIIDNIEQRINLWIKFFFKGSLSSRIEVPEPNIALAYKILGKLAIRSREVPRVERIFIVNYLPKIYASLSTVPMNQLVAALRCCEICLKLFPHDTYPYKGKIEQFLKKQICCLNNDTSIYVGKCFHLLQTVRDKIGKNQKEQWSIYMQELLHSVHILLNQLYSKYSNNVTYTTKGSESGYNMILSDDKLSKDLIEKYGQLYLQFRNIVNYLIIAIRDPFPVKKPLMVQKILNVIIRGFSVTNAMLLEFSNTESLILEPILPKIHMDLIKLLNVLIVIVKYNIRPYSSVITRLLSNTLKWTSDLKTKDPQQLVGPLRNKTYEAISLWCNIMTTGSRVEVVIKELLEEIFYDLSITQQTIEPVQKLTIQEKPKSEKKQKYQFKLNQTETKGNGKEFNYLEASLNTGNENQCNLVVISNCLYNILQSSLILIDSSTMKMIYVNILKLSSQLFQPKAIKYSNSKFYANLYNILYLLISTTNSYTSQFKNLLYKSLSNAALYSRSNELNENIYSAQAIENLIHPIKDGLLYPNKIDNISDVLSNTAISSTVVVNCSKSTEEVNVDVAVVTEMDDDSDTGDVSLSNKEPVNNSAENNTINSNLNKSVINNDHNIENECESTQNNDITNEVSIEETTKQSFDVEEEVNISPLKEQMKNEISTSVIDTTNYIETISPKKNSLHIENDNMKPEDINMFEDIAKNFVDELIE